jgi:hypothetical protein
MGSPAAVVRWETKPPPSCSPKSFFVSDWLHAGRLSRKSVMIVQNGFISKELLVVWSVASDRRNVLLGDGSHEKAKRDMVTAEKERSKVLRTLLSG